MLNTRLSRLLVMLVVVSALTGCSSYKSSGGNPNAPTSLEDKAALTVTRFRQRDPSMKRFFDSAYGYAVFPTVAKGAIGVGAAHGNGVVYEQGKVVGYTDLTQGSIGFQLGGQVYSELIFFQDKPTLDHFKQGNMEFSAQASAVAAAAGAASNADFDAGVAVFSLGEKGLMFEASVGGQKFSYRNK